MRLLDTNVRYLDSTCFESPQLTNEWGSTINVLNYALVEGSPEQLILSISTKESLEEFGSFWLCTLTLNPGHKFLKDLSVILVSGCSDISYNGLHRVQDVTETEIVIALDKTLYEVKPLDLTEENMKVKLAPIGFEKAFEGFNKAAYRSLSRDRLSRMYLRVDNSKPEGYDPTWAKFSRVSAISDMRYIDDTRYRQGRFKVPYEGSVYETSETSEGAGQTGVFGSSKWYQRLDSTPYLYECSEVTSEGSAAWELIGDSRTFYYFPDVLNSELTYKGRGSYCFGEYSPITPSIYNYILCCSYKLGLKAQDALGEYYSDPGLLEKYNTFSRVSYIAGNLLMNSNKSSELASGNSEEFSFEATAVNKYSSSADVSTGLISETFNLSLTLLPLSIVSSKKIFKGSARGYQFIANDRKVFESLNIPLRLKRVFSNNYENSNTKSVILLSSMCRSDSTPGNTFIAFSLNNWE